MEPLFTPPYHDISRSDAPEIMDDMELSGHLLEKELSELERINWLLGGIKCLRNALQKVLTQYHYKPGDFVKIVDWGCGSGDHPRAMADYLRKTGLKFEITAIDANPNVIQLAKKKSIHYPEIYFIQADIFETPRENYHIATASLFFHHLNDANIMRVFSIWGNHIKQAVIVNDLRREKRAYQLFKLFAKVFGSPAIARHDGLISILRSFKVQEIDNWNTGEHFHRKQVKKFPLFRWQIILNKTA